MTSHYLNQCWTSSPTHICGTRGDGLRFERTPYNCRALMLGKHKHELHFRHYSILSISFVICLTYSRKLTQNTPADDPAISTHTRNYATWVRPVRVYCTNFLQQKLAEYWRFWSTVVITTRFNCHITACVKRYSCQGAFQKRTRALKSKSS